MAKPFETTPFELPPVDFLDFDGLTDNAEDKIPFWEEEDDLPGLGDLLVDYQMSSDRFPVDRFPIDRVPLDRIPEQAQDMIPPPEDETADIDAIVANRFDPNQLLTNQGGDQGGAEGTFIASDLEGGMNFSNAVALGDIDGDGDLDALVANLGTNQLLTNQGGLQGGTEGMFVASDLDGGVLWRSNGITLGDIDGDGDLDALVATNGVNELLTNQGGAQKGTEGDFVASDLGEEVLWSIDIALGDVDGDGSVPAVDAHGFPNINLDGLLPDAPVPQEIA